jgi:hypothetical protein
MVRYCVTVYGYKYPICHAARDPTARVVLHAGPNEVIASPSQSSSVSSVSGESGIVGPAASDAQTSALSARTHSSCTREAIENTPLSNGGTAFIPESPSVPATREGSEDISLNTQGFLSTGRIVVVRIEVQDNGDSMQQC